MNLFEDKIVKKLIEELKNHKRIYMNKNSKAPKFIFLCGKQILDENGKIKKDNIDNNIRYYIKEMLEKKERNNHRSYYCILSEQLYSDEMKIDILTFEKLLAIISDEIVIITESAGTYCELGAFVLEDNFMKKTIVINEDKKEYKNSFITKGPIAKLKSDNSSRVILHGGYKRIIATNEFHDKLMNVLSSSTYNNKINDDYNLLDVKSLIYELAAIIEIFQPITPYELDNLYKELFNILTTYKLKNNGIRTVNSINDVVGLMIKMNIIDVNRQLLTLNGGLSFYDYLFSIPASKKDSLRVKYLSRVYKLDSDRMEKKS